MTRGIDIKLYPSNQRALSLLTFKSRSDMEFLLKRITVAPVGIVWEAGWLSCNELSPRPSWPAFMTDVCMGSSALNACSAVADVRMLPIIDMNPKDLSCIYSTLCFIEKQSKLLNVTIPCVTFDQPLWLKSVDIVETCNMNVFRRLGLFHALMSFIGSLGTVMEGSGLSDLWEGPKHGLKCVTACENCIGTCCANSSDSSSDIVPDDCDADADADDVQPVTVLVDDVDNTDEAYDDLLDVLIPWTYGEVV